MDSYTCFVCETPFERYASQVRNPAEACCSVECRGVKHRTSLRGEANPNYRHGKHVGPSLCVCGRAKDYRAEACALCSKRGPSKSGESLYDEHVLREAVLTSTSLSAAAMLVGCSRHIVTSFAKKNDLNLSHMRGGRGRPRSYESVFCYKEKRDPATRGYLRRLDPEWYFCTECGQLPWWNGKELTLQMDHIDGNSRNDCRDNLRWLCPNCHTQTETFTGRNASYRKEHDLRVGDAHVRS